MASLAPGVGDRARDQQPNNFILLNARLFSRIWTDILPVSMTTVRGTGISASRVALQLLRDKLTQSLDGILQDRTAYRTSRAG